MSFSIQPQQDAEQRATNGRLIGELQHAIDRNYEKIREAARTQWERLQVGAFDPSDACVSVRIAPRATDGKTRAGGMLPTQTTTPSLTRAVWSLVLSS